MGAPAAVAQGSISASAAVVAAIGAVHEVDAPNGAGVIWREGQRPRSSTGPAEDTEPALDGAALAELSESEHAHLLEDDAESEEPGGGGATERAIAQAIAAVRGERERVGGEHAGAWEPCPGGCGARRHAFWKDRRP